ERRDGRRRGAVLACARLGDQAGLLEPARQESLPDRVVDLVRTGVEQIFALEIYPRAAEPAGEVSREVERRRTPCVLAQPARELATKRRGAAETEVRPLEIDERRHQRFRDVAPAVLAEVALGVRQTSRGG